MGKSKADDKPVDNRCDWCTSSEIYRDYHDKEWGIPCYDDQQLFEMLILEGAQAGLSWITILKKREGYRRAFSDFDPVRIGRFSEAKQLKLMQNEGIVRNRLKIQATVTNARLYNEMQKNGESFSQFLWSFVDYKPIQNEFVLMSEVPAKTEQSDAMSKALKKRGFKFVGSTICYAFMQATGMVNDHLVRCPRWKVIKKGAGKLKKPANWQKDYCP